MGSIVNSVADVFGIGPASKQLKAADRAADISAAASREAIDLQRQMYYEGVARQQPWLEAGQIALNKLIPEATNYQNFGMEQFKQDPGYAFRMSEGMKALLTLPPPVRSAGCNVVFRCLRLLRLALLWRRCLLLVLD